MIIFDKDVKPMSNPKDYGIRMEKMRKKNRNRCAVLIKEAYRKRARK